MRCSRRASSSRDLALVVIDEQHRFGVHQRLALRDKGVGAEGHPHQLVMTATPIPRTLAMAAYADLDTSIIDELPPGRQPVSTVAYPTRGATKSSSACAPPAPRGNRRTGSAR